MWPSATAAATGPSKFLVEVADTAAVGCVRCGDAPAGPAASDEVSTRHPVTAASNLDKGLRRRRPSSTFFSTVEGPEALAGSWLMAFSMVIEKRIRRRPR